MVGRCSTCQSRSLRSDNAHVAVPKHARPHGEQTPRAHAPHSHSSSLRLDLPGASMPAAAERIRRARFARGRLPMARGSSPPSRSKCKDAPMLSASFRSQAERGRMQRGILKGGTCRVVGHSTVVVAADVPLHGSRVQGSVPTGVGLWATRASLNAAELVGTFGKAASRPSTWLRKAQCVERHGGQTVCDPDLVGGGLARWKRRKIRSGQGFGRSFDQVKQIALRILEE